MPRNPNTHGGGARTNLNGLFFEQITSLEDTLINAGYTVINHEVYRDTEKIGMCVPQYRLYTHFLTPNGICYKNYNSKKWLPDEAFINFKNNTVYIIEKKFQNCAGSVDEKLPGCHFKKLEYQKLFQPLHFNVEFLYLFNDWFKDERYRDTLKYIEDMECHYFYNFIPLDFLGL
ncbi:MAG: PD-(D/E)XK nuclease superfamily protein [Blautia sp.]